MSITYNYKSLRCEKTCLRDFRQSETQTSLLSYGDKLEYQNSACINWSHNAYQKSNNKCADQTARTRRLVCAFVVRLQQTQALSRRGPYLYRPYRIMYMYTFTFFRQACAATQCATWLCFNLSLHHICMCTANDLMR